MNNRPLLVFILSGLLSLTAFADENLLKNPELKQEDGQGAPIGWKVYGNIQKITTDTKEAPAGGPHSLRVDIEKDGGKSLGQIVQKIPVTANTEYALTLDIKSSVSDLALGQIKLLNLRSELKRIQTDSSGTSWSTVKLSFNSEGADNVWVVLRYKQKEEQIGETVWFANPVLTKGR
ncbi:MAG: DUF642 domain-containing protein [Kiritimatiellae bacterium]|jgi:hypothetical protein|nr:DUF642 domain-containing protein [Kiritimatiellia bacterium]